MVADVVIEVYNGEVERVYANGCIEVLVVDYGPEDDGEHPASPDPGIRHYKMHVWALAHIGGTLKAEVDKAYKEG